MTQLRETSRLHGRSLERARDERAAAGVIEFEIGSTGPGNATFYRLLLGDGNDRATADDSRSELTAETTAPVRSINDRTNDRASAVTQGVKGYLEDQGLETIDFETVKSSLREAGLLEDAA